MDADVVVKSEVKPSEEVKKQVEEGGQFTCALCNWSERYHGKGTSVPFARGVVFHEEAYVMRDPFVPYGQNLYVFLGAACSVCNRTCCQQCSLYYSKRFCNKCAQENVDHFPVEVQKKIRELDATK